MADNDFSMGYAMGRDGTNNGGGFGGMFGEGLWAIIILAMLGFGNGGFGGGNMRNDISDGFLLNGIDNGIRGVQQGLCDGFYAMNTSMLTGFNNVQSQMANCCCETQRLIERGFCDTNYNMATQSCEIKQAIADSSKSIIDYLTNEKIDSLRAENQALRFSASQDRQNALLTTAMTAQTNALIDRLAPTPIPSYTVPAPYGYGWYGNGYGGNGHNNGCGCNNGCGF